MNWSRRDKAFVSLGAIGLGFLVLLLLGVVVGGPPAIVSLVLGLLGVAGWVAILRWTHPQLRDTHFKGLDGRPSPPSTAPPPPPPPGTGAPAPPEARQVIDEDDVARRLADQHRSRLDSGETDQVGDGTDAADRVVADPPETEARAADPPLVAAEPAGAADVDDDAHEDDEAAPVAAEPIEAERVAAEQRVIEQAKRKETDRRRREAEADQAAQREADEREAAAAARQVIEEREAAAARQRQADEQRRAEAERVEAERVEAERVDQERERQDAAARDEEREQRRLDAERQEEDRREAQRQEARRQEAERQAAAETARLEDERRDAERRARDQEDPTLGGEPLQHRATTDAAVATVVADAPVVVEEAAAPDDQDVDADAGADAEVIEWPSRETAIIDEEAITGDDDILAASQVAALPSTPEAAVDESQKQIYLLNKVRLKLSDYE